MTDRSRRTYVVTGSSSGIGRATVELLRTRGSAVVGVDRANADIVADLASAAGRAALVDGVAEAVDGAVDAVIACAGVIGQDAEQLLRVNYFGTVATLAGLRPLLERGTFPRAVAISSRALLNEVDASIVDACLAGEEPLAVRLAAAARDGVNVYACAKRALAQWVRREAVTQSWAGAGIALNAVAPGAIRTPMTAAFIDSGPRLEQERRLMPLLRRPGTPEQVAALAVWLASGENELVTGQVIFADGGSDAVLRGHDVW